jgi:hypothetical protein
MPRSVGVGCKPTIYVITEDLDALRFSQGSGTC